MILPKPPVCQGCPFYQSGQGFVPDELYEGAGVFVYGQNPGSEEEAVGRPFVGVTGQTLDRSVLPLTGLSREQVSVGNALRCRWKGSNELPPLTRTLTRDAIVHCTRAHFRLPPATKVIIAQGGYALRALTGEGVGSNRTITAWRGAALPLQPATQVPIYGHVATSIWVPGPRDVVVLATVHLAALGRDPSLWLPIQLDWQKVPRLLRREWPVPLPPIIEGPPLEWPAVAAVDTEYNPETGVVYRYSLASDGPNGLRVWVVDGATVPPLAGTHVIAHNIEAEWPFLQANQTGPWTWDDTMLAHAVLWSDLPHTLDFVGSLYARINRWKHLERTNPREYSAGDAIGAWDAWLALDRSFRSDPLSARIYREAVKPLVPIIHRATTTGLRTDQGRARAALVVLQSRMDHAAHRAQAAAGWPLNIGSQRQVAHHLYAVEGGH